MSFLFWHFKEIYILKDMQVTLLSGIIYTVSSPSFYNHSATGHLPLTQA